MTDQPELKPQPKPSTEEAILLKKIEEHLGSVRSMMKFFVFITLLYMVFSFFGAMLSF